MCDAADDMVEYIEYEFARDCIEIDEVGDDSIHGIVQADADNLIVQSNDQLPEDSFLYGDDYEIVEELEEEVDQPLVSDSAFDIKTEVLERTDQEDQKGIKEEFLDQDTEEDHLIDEDTASGYGQEEEFHEIEYEEVGFDEDEINPETETITPDKKIETKIEKPPPVPCPDDKGPKGTARKYMLFDELVATIVDYDPDGTPIVEFSISNNDADEKLPMECGICPDVMNRAKIPTHLKTHLVPGTNRYQCIYCDESYKDCKYLAGHARRHMGIRPYVCELCKLYFSTKQDLRVHNQRRHQEKDHICEVCGKTFAQNTQLKRHREATHEKKRRFKCDLCPKSYYKNFSLQEHIRAVHMGKRRIIVCPFCGMQCRDAHKMARHRKQYHLHQTHFECHICNEEFTDINYFDAHKRSIQCRNNTRRKQEEEGLIQKQEEEQQQQIQMQTLQQNNREVLKTEILPLDDNSQQYSQNSNDQQLLIHQLDESQQQHPHIDDIIETVQIIDDSDYKQFMLNNDLLQTHKIEELSSDVAEDEELVYEVTIGSNE